MNNEWKEYKLGDCVSIINGYAFKSANFTEKQLGNSLPIVKIKNVANGDVNLDGVQYHSYNDNYKTYLVKNKDILIALTGNHPDALSQVVGGVSIYKLSQEALLNQRVAKIIPNDKIIDRYFLYYFINNHDFHYELASKSSGSASQANISKKDIEDMTICLPSLPMQKCIAGVLSSLDDKIDLLNRQNQTLEAMAESLFRHWFVDNAKPEWEERKIGDFVSTNKSSISKDYQYKIISYLDTGSLNDGSVNQLQELNIEEAPSRAKRLVKHNDILISTVRPDQKHYGIIKNPLENLVVSTGFCVISCEKINPHFIYILLTTAEMIDFLHSIAEGSTSTYPSLKPSDIESIEFKMPPDSKLNEFAEYCDNIWSKIDINQNQIRTLIKLRDTLLPKLMSNEIKL